jgi:hypothetical protein
MSSAAGEDVGQRRDGLDQPFIEPEQSISSVDRASATGLLRSRLNRRLSAGELTSCARRRPSMRPSSSPNSQSSRCGRGQEGGEQARQARHIDALARDEGIEPLAVVAQQRLAHQRRGVSSVSQRVLQAR